MTVRADPGRPAAGARGRRVLRALVASVLWVLCSGLGLPPGSPQPARGQAAVSPRPTAGHPAPSVASPGAVQPPALEIDRVRSYFVAVTGRAGVLGFMGHRHGVLARDWEIDFAYDPASPEASRVSVRVPTAALEVDTARAQRRARLRTRPSEQDIPEIRARMLGPDQLRADEYPTIEFRSTEVRRTDRGFEVRGEFTLVGVTREVTVPVRLRRLQRFTIFEGEFSIRQRDFGIEPVSIGGVVKVADEVQIRFELWTTGLARADAGP